MLQTFGYDGYANNNNTNARNNDWQREYKDGLDLLVEQTKEIISAESSGIRGRELANIAPQRQNVALRFQTMETSS